MDERTFFNNLGFDDNPFGSTNADEEDRLEQYFIPPPYFTSVFGDPDKPASNVVFAPRGGGKSAQRRMIELRSVGAGILCLTYDRFEFPVGRAVDTITLEYHLRNVLRIGIVGLLTQLQNQEQPIQRLNKNDRSALLSLAQEHLGNVTEDQLKRSVDALKSFPEKAKDLWNRWLPMTGLFLAAILKKLGLDPRDLPTFGEAPESLGASLKYQCELLQRLCQKVDLSAIYVLIDKVDETELTGNDARASYALIGPLLRDLDVLEMKGYGFKFFLWDKLQSHHSKYARPDRIRQYEMQWREDALARMLALRLSAYSAGRITSLSQISEDPISDGIEPCVLLFAGNSPRDVIRICGRIATEQIELNPFSRLITEKAVSRGIDEFCDVRAGEIVADDASLRNLKRIRRADFTINFLANQVFKETYNASRNKIKIWANSGLVKEVGTAIGPHGRPIKRYALTDLRVARVVFPAMPVEGFLELKCRQCPECNSVVIRDWDESEDHQCQECQFEVRATVREAPDMPEGVAQLPLFDNSAE